MLRFDLYFSETSGKGVLRYGSFYVMITQETSMPALSALRRNMTPPHQGLETIARRNTEMTIFGGGYFPGLIIIIGILMIAAFLKMKEGLKTFKNNNREPVRSDRAVLLKKEHSRVRGNTSLASQGKTLLPEISVTWTLTFILEHHGMMVLELTDKEARLLKEGMTGKLSWQGTRFLSFR